MFAASTALSPPPVKTLHRLFVLRNIEIAGQLTAVAVAARILATSLPFAALLAVIGVLAAVNGMTWLRLKQPWPVTETELFLHLLADALALTLLLYLSGGSTNPFVSLYLLPLIIAATILPAAYAWAMALFTLGCYTLLLFYYLPLSRYDAEASVIGALFHHGAAYPHAGPLIKTHFGLHVLGMWFNFLVSAGLIAFFVNRLARSLRERDARLARAREEALRNEQIIALGALAAGAAHEFSTPLASMAIIVKELQQTAGLSPEWTNDLRLLYRQIESCKQTLTNLTIAAGESRAENGGSCALDQYLENVVKQWRLMRPAAAVTARWPGPQPAPMIMAERTLSQALINLFNNAADASPHEVDIEGHWNNQRLTVTIRDRGPGLTPEAAANAGEAFFTTKKTGRGIGLLLANATIDRLGGAVRMFNREGGGARVEISIPLAKLTTTEAAP